LPADWHHPENAGTAGENFKRCVKEQLQNVNKESTYLSLDGGNADAGHFVHAMK
jgi:hypothetical protein